MKHPPAFDRTVAALRYTYPIDRLMQAYKYDGALALAAWFTGKLAPAIGVAPTVDLVIPMPLFATRLRERGFNQAHEIARRIADRLGLPVDPLAVRRVRDTQVQADLPIDERPRNVRGAFTANAAVMGRRIAVVDDVMTTGATLDALAKTLKVHGALHVENWVVARALLSP